MSSGRKGDETASVALEPGTKLGHYVIVSVLGIGGFGVTYLVKDPTLEKRFAVKEYFPEIFAYREGGTVRARTTSREDYEWGRQRFVDEARILAKFSHPNIVGVMQVFEANNSAYMVMEYQEGRSLKEWFEEIETPPLRSIAVLG